jgi:ribosomal subunit interface protein
MDILVRGRNVPVDPAIEAESRRKLGKLPRYAPDIRRVEVEFSEIRNPRAPEKLQCEVIVHLTRNFVKAHATASDARTALDRVIDKVEHQVGRVKSKRIGRSRPRHGEILLHVE